MVPLRCSAAYYYSKLFCAPFISKAAENTIENPHMSRLKMYSEAHYTENSVLNMGNMEWHTAKKLLDVALFTKLLCGIRYVVLFFYPSQDGSRTFHGLFSVFYCIWKDLKSIISGPIHHSKWSVHFYLAWFYYDGSRQTASRLLYIL